MAAANVVNAGITNRPRLLRPLENRPALLDVGFCESLSSIEERQRILVRFCD